MLVLSDTHGGPLFTSNDVPRDIDVVIHCGDLTDEFKLAEFEETLRHLKNIEAPLKLIIAGNHDFTLDQHAFKKKIAEARVEEDLIEKEYGTTRTVRELIDRSQEDNIFLLDEGNYSFTLRNGAMLKVYASPYTPSTEDWGFQYHPSDDHKWSIESGTDVVITHGPPRGILDLSGSKRLGSPSLFEAVARVQPRLHCFGHIHQQWGAKMAVWRPQKYLSDAVNHFTAIDNDATHTVETRAALMATRYDDPALANEKKKKLRRLLALGYAQASWYQTDVDPLTDDSQTLFVNAAVEGISDDFPMHPPWIVDIDLPIASSPKSYSNPARK